MSRHIVAGAHEIAPGERRLFTLEGKPVVVFNLGGEFFGLLNRCPHQGGSLCDGTVTGLLESPDPGQYRYGRAGEIVRCPWHGWEFDIRTGRSFCAPDRIRVRRFPVEAQPGHQLRNLPAAETVPVRVEDDYLVVEV